MRSTRAFGPFLPTGQDPTGTDLGICLRDEFFCSERIAGSVRQGLKRGLGESIEANQPGPAMHFLQGFIDSFPVAGMIDQARQVWTLAPDPMALSVLARAANLICLGEGLEPLRGGPWPRPSEAWIREQIQEAEVIVQDHPEDGASWIAEHLGIELKVGPLAPLPEVLPVAGEDLAARREEIVSTLVREEAVAIVLTSPLPEQSESLLAMGEVRLEALAQQAFEAYGRAGLVVQDYVSFDALLGPAPPQAEGACYGPICEAALLPGTPAGVARGELKTTGWLLWEDAVKPVAVHPIAVELVRSLDGTRDVDALSTVLSLDPERVSQILDVLLKLGAIRAITPGECD